MKISLTHHYQAFNVKLQAEFMCINIRQTKHCVLHIVDTRSRWSVFSIVSTLSRNKMTNTVEIFWILQHGAPQRFSVDSKFLRRRLRRFLEFNNIHLADRLRGDKTGQGSLSKKKPYYKTNTWTPSNGWLCCNRFHSSCKSCLLFEHISRFLHFIIVWACSRL